MFGSGAGLLLKLCTVVISVAIGLASMPPRTSDKVAGTGGPDGKSLGDLSEPVMSRVSDALEEDGAGCTLGIGFDEMAPAFPSGGSKDVAVASIPRL